MGCADTRARHVSVTETQPRHRVALSPSPDLFMWTDPPAVGGCVFTVPFTDRALVLGGVCSRVPATGLRLSPRGSLPVGTVLSGPAQYLRRRRRTLPAFCGDLSPLHACSANAHPQPPDMKTFLHPHAQRRPLHPTHPSPSMPVRRQEDQLVSHPQLPSSAQLAVRRSSGEDG